MDMTDLGLIRLRNLGIAGSVMKTPAEVVRHLGAVQAQDYPGTLWALGLRLPGTQQADIERAVASGSVVRTWPQRGTLHFVAPEEVRWRLSLTTPRILRQAVSRHQSVGLDDATFERARELFERALEGGKQLTRQEMMDLLANAGISTSEQRGYHILWYWSQRALLVFGAPKGKQQTFALLDDVIPETPEITREEALARLAKSYLTSHGPATVADLAYWSGMTQTDVNIGLEAVKGDLTEVKIGGKSYWTKHVTPTDRRDVFLLPGFDEYLLGYKDRSAVLDLEHSAKVAPGFNGVFTPTIVMDGKVEGLWKREIKRSQILVNVTPFISFTNEQKQAIYASFKRYEEFMGLPVTVNI